MKLVASGQTPDGSYAIDFVVKRSGLLKNDVCRLLKKVSETRRAKNRRAEAYVRSTLERDD
jgi:hypothetical protein